MRELERAQQRGDAALRPRDDGCTALEQRGDDGDVAPPARHVQRGDGVGVRRIDLLFLEGREQRRNVAVRGRLCTRVRSRRAWCGSAGRTATICCTT